MGRRGERPLKELYDLTERLAGPEITPVLEGSCRIQGPVDESDHELRRANSGVSTAEKGFKFINESSHVGAESGTCNVCSAPCSSCLHYNRTVSIMESNVEGGFSSNALRKKEADSCSCIGVNEPPHYKSRACDDQNATSETSNLMSASSSHDSYSGNAESKASLRLSGTYDTLEDVDMRPNASSDDAVGEDVEEKHRLEYHGDSVSCVTGVRDANVAVHDPNVDLDKKDVTLSSASTKNVLEKGLEEVVQVVAAHGYHNHEIEEGLDKPLSSRKNPKEFLQKKNSDSKSVGGDLGSQHQAEAFECSKNNVESSLGQQSATDNVDERKPAVLSNVEDSQTVHLRGSSGTSGNARSCLEAETGMDNEIPFDEALKCSATNESSEKLGSLLEASNTQEPEMHPLPARKGENSDSDIEDDVKVCDICGDAGREECLAICSRCSDGAEHTYCMQIMLDKVPEGDWLCEECQVKEENENRKAEKSELVTQTSKIPSLNEKSQNVGSVLGDKLLPKLDTKTIIPEDRGLNRGLQSPKISAKKHSDNLEATSVTSKKVSESISGLEAASPRNLEATSVTSKKVSESIRALEAASPRNLEATSVTSKKVSESISALEAASPRKKPLLSRESSFKNLDVGKGKSATMSQSCGNQSAKSSQASVRSQISSALDTLKNQSQLPTSRGSFSKPTLFNNPNVKGKVIQLIENVHHKQKITRESAPGDRRKDGLVGAMSKSASFKTLSSGRSNVESVSKGSSVNSLWAEDLQGMKQVKEKASLERKNSFVADRSLPSPSPAATASTSIPPVKTDQKAPRREGKSNNMAEPNIPGINKGLDDASDPGRREVKRQSASLSKGVESPSSNGSYNSEGQKPSMLLQRSMSQVSESHRDNRTKDSSFLSNSRQTVPGGGRILRCQKCNETGHSTQFCSIDKLRVSALKPSTERISREPSNKSSKWKDAVESAISKIRSQKGSKLSDQPEEAMMPSAELCSEVASTNAPSSSSSSPRNFPSLVEKTDGQGILRYLAAENSKKVAVTDVKQQVREGDAVVASSDELNVKPSTEILPTHASVFGNPLRASAIPEFEFIWQGGFEVQKTGKVHEVFSGVQAHLSNCASPKVLDVVTKFPCNIKLEEVPRHSAWPSQFEGSGPREDNIALFFFAKDVESYEKNYTKLLDNVLQNDLALKGSIEGVELLIFPSTTLPGNSQRWNMLFFLWGVFRERRVECIENLPGSKKRSCVSSLDIEPMVQDVSSPAVAEVSTSQRKDPYENQDESMSDRSPKAKALKHSNGVDLLPIPSSGIQKKTGQTQESPLVQASPFPGSADDKLPPEHPSCSYSVSSSLKSISQPHGSLGNYSEPGLQVDSAKLCSGVRNDVNFLKNLGRDSDSGKEADFLAHVHPDNVQISFSKSSGLPTCSGPLFCRQGTGAQSLSEVKLRENEIHVKREVALDENPMELDRLSWESRTNRKRSHSCSIDTISQASGETSRSTDEAIPWRERANIVSSEDEKDHKKMRIYGDGHASSSSSREENLSSRLSSKVHPLLPGFLSENRHRDSAYETSRSAERYLFPVEKGSVKDTKTDNFIQVLSSDDEDLQESNVPNLELALGGKKKPSKKEALPLFFPLVDRSNMHDKPPVDDGDASLSLSLAFPDTEKERKAKPVPKTEPLLPERPCVNTSLLLFGGFRDA